MPRKVPNQKKHEKCPHSISDLAVAVQGRNAGICSRALAFFIDEGTVLLLFSIGMALVGVILQNWDGFHVPVWAVPILYYLFQVFYSTCSLAIVGRTFGKILVGLLVVRSTHKVVSPWQALPRSLLTAFLLPVLFFAMVGLIREDRRGFHDILCCTTVIYAWDAKNFRRRQANMTDSEKDRQPYANYLLEEEANTV